MTIVDVNALGSGGGTVGTLSSTVEPIIHGIVGAQFGDLEFDVGKSVRWTQWFIDDLYIQDINTGEQRYWVINWTASFPEAEYGVSGNNFFRQAALWRAEQFAAADKRMSYNDQDWVIFVDSHEGFSVDVRSLPDDYNAQPFKSWVYREIQRAVDAGKTEVAVPFHIYLKYTDLQNITYPAHAGGNATPLTQSISVPWYLPNNALVRIIKVSALRNPAFDWSKLDTPSTLAKPELATPGALHLNSARGNWAMATRTILPTFNTLQFTIHCKLDQMPHTTVSLMGFLAGTNYLLMNADGGMQIISWTAVGANTVLAGNLASSGVAPIKVGVPIWLRGKLTYTTALCEYWYSYDGQTWTSIGAVTGFNAGTLPYLSNSATVMIGNISQSIQTFPGDIYEAYDTIDGVNRIRFVANQDLKTWTSGTTFTTTSGDPGVIYGAQTAATKPAFFPGGANGNYLALNTYGVASTADPGPLPNEFVLIAEAGLATTPPFPTYSASFASQYHADPQRSWAWKRNSLNSGVQFTAAPTGTSAGATTRAINYFTTGPQGTTELCALSVTLNNGSGNSVFQNWKSIDNGVTWVSASNPTTFPTIVPIDSNELLRIGGWVAYEINQGPIYRVEARNGLDPKGGGATPALATPGYITFPGTAGNSMTTPDAALLRVVGDITILARIRPVDWTPTGAQSFVARNTNVDPNRLYALTLNPAGTLILSWSPDGTGAAQKVATSSVAVGAVDGTWKWVAATLDVDNGSSGWSARFWTSDDGVTWTQLGTTQTVATVTSILAGTAPLTIAILGNGVSQPFNGDISHVSVRNGIGAAGIVGGTEVFRYDASTDISPTISPTAANFIAFSGQTMTVNRSGSPATAIVPATAGLLWKCDAAEAAAGIPARTDRLLNADTDGDGIANGWVVYSGTSVNNKSLSVVDGYQRIVGAPTAINMTYGVQRGTPPYIAVVPGQSYAFEAIFRVSGATPRVAANFVAYWFDAGNVQGATAGSTNFRVNSDGWVRALWFGIAPATAATVRLMARIIGLTGANGTETITLDVKQMSVIPMSWTIRGRLWSLHNPDVMLKAGDNPVPLTSTVVAPNYVSDVKTQIVSYGYAHWNIQDIPPGETKTPDLTAENDLGYQMRNLLSLCRPIAGIPFGTPWQDPSTDPASLPGPWSVDMYINTDPDLVATVEEKGHTPPNVQTAGVGVPLYDIAMRINLRDGLWYERGVNGNIPLTWDEVNQVWVPLYSPEQWPTQGVDAPAIPPPAPSLLALKLNGQPGSYVHADDANYFDFADQEAFTLVAAIAPASWTPLTRKCIVSKWKLPNQLSWYWAIEAGGGLVLAISRDGTTVIEASCDLTDAPGLANLPDNQLMFLAISFSTNLTAPIQDQVDYWVSPDTQVWASLCAEPTMIDNPSALNLFASTADINVGAIDAGSDLNFDGFVRLVSIRRGIAPSTVGGDEVGIFRGDISENPSYDRYGNLWINNGTWNYEVIT